MRAKGWLNGATLLEEWFNNSENDDPTKGTPDTTTIKMDAWALKFSRAKSAYDDLIAKRIWLNPPARDLLLMRLKGMGKISDNEQTFGDVTVLTMTQVDSQSVNFKAVGTSWTDKILDPLDDMFAALGAFTFKVIVQGRVAPPQDSWSLQPPYTHRVTIEKVGVYIKDSFDFNGPQFLGAWQETPPDVTRDPVAYPDSHTRVDNADFRAWRSQNHKGGDFLVFSDIKWTALTPPDTFAIVGRI